ncbi:bifunctional adenosylcobinamide kinase/adenosylcobinamide-phosphate guanylyltransferase [Sporanaerobium hydrogeniformans]|uniref:Bifunctional adenosylcobinamide kinase/adenosylcobinamide-phosphate guanylyltransferase n=1 Tax=Sporanaerobium hydrogeniformans TaxID=3072179 RepID=A0AC61DEK4_9FIRM|nr:bifunctional adenosylcobinamide kinase/adenosylcobinamide-phosphate guanylyltransferase [Sporanaerobium hydrogeniformans]PHV70982.1 bifunctional adenosylcobinamide kinase/adenosylcobinamide-phosphate guanylyltransferase [Sporanaerobium hydrogeniformans]
MPCYEFVQNRECEHFPCHPTPYPEEFNCLFCYCPLYGLKNKCGGNFVYLKNGIKSCINCLKPHDKEGYRHVQSHIKEVMELGKLEVKEKKMSKIVLVTGGARSGKSTYAEQLCKEQNNSTAYIATSVPFDDDFRERVKKHQQSRPNHWTTYEVYEDIYKQIGEIGKKHETVILDCVTLMVNNLMFKENIDYDTCSQEDIDQLEKHIKEQVAKLIEEIEKTSLYFVAVTNEIGLSPVADNRLTRIYTDIIGRVNQQFAKSAREVYLVVSGIPVCIKQS